jgi:hypothetical protein
MQCLFALLHLDLFLWVKPLTGKRRLICYNPREKDLKGGNRKQKER